jgi:ribosomal peptide maturation radical SAM protein 1
MSESQSERARVVLVSMPFALINRPSIQLGILRAVLEREGLPVAARSFNLAFHEHLMLANRPGEPAFDILDDERFNENQRMAVEWMFAVPPFREIDAARDRAYLDYLRRMGTDEAVVAKIVRARTLVPSFLERCAADILDLAPEVVGFTTTFAQNVPSLVLAKMLVDRHPSLTIVFGGANCDGAMGVALHRAFPWVDVVVRGEAERVFPALLRDRLAGREIGAHPGLCVRRGSETVVHDFGGPPVAMDDVPVPDYREYFERLARSPLRAEVTRGVILQVESARGCWWGQKMHCTFCGLNGSTMAFRSKTPANAAADIVELARRHRVLRLDAVDNIVDMTYVRELLPRLREADHGFGLFYETKSNLKRAELRALRMAGVIAIQPGIESLSTPILALMKKGVTALQNLRLLKWCKEMRIHVAWNILYGFPGEDPAEYQRMARLIGTLGHLQAPKLVRVRVQRFSPYFARAAEHGLRITGPAEYYRHLYDLDPATLHDLAYFFDHEHVDGAEPEGYVAPLRAAVDGWSQQGIGSLTYQRGPGFIEIVDARTPQDISRYVLEGREAEIFLACDAGATPMMVARALGAEDVDLADIQDFLDELAESGLVYEERGRYLALANPYDALRTLFLEEREVLERSARCAPAAGADRAAAPAATTATAARRLLVLGAT